MKDPHLEHRRTSTAARYVENERTGERVEFVHESPELMHMEVTWTRPGHRTVRHAHPGMEERWEVIEGSAAFEVDGVWVEAGPGSCVIAPLEVLHENQRAAHPYERRGFADDGTTATHRLMRVKACEKSSDG